MKKAIGLIVAMVAIGAVSYVLWTIEGTTPAFPIITVVRHAERVDDSPNSDLSRVGLARAEALIEETGMARAIYCTDFCRTVQTALPVAREWDLPIHVIKTGHPAADLDSCDPPIDVELIEVNGIGMDAKKLVDHVRSSHPVWPVVIVGHSNTVPDIVAALGDGHFDSFTIASDEYDNVFRVTLPRDGDPILERRTLSLPASD